MLRQQLESLLEQHLRAAAVAGGEKHVGERDESVAAVAGAHRIEQLERARRAQRRLRIPAERHQRAGLLQREARIVPLAEPAPRELPPTLEEPERLQPVA